MNNCVARYVAGLVSITVNCRLIDAISPKKLTARELYHLVFRIIDLNIFGVITVISFRLWTPNDSEDEKKFREQ